MTSIKPEISETLRAILQDTARELEEDRSRESLSDLKRMVSDAPAALSFRAALAAGRAMIAEIKERSPSQGAMVAANVSEAASAYKASPLVKAVSILTSRTHFGENMRIENLRRLKEKVSKPVLRKDFMIDEYQVYQARAYGADAILLMANVVTRDAMRRLSDLAFELGMDVLFETHSASEFEDLPKAAKIVGINCRNFSGRAGMFGRFGLARFSRQWLGSERDHSVDLSRFEYAADLPAHITKIAESGVTPDNCAQVFALGFQAILVGTSILMDRRGVSAALGDFESAILRAMPQKVAASL